MTEPNGAMPGAIGPYRVDARIGRGGMGEIYRGYDTRLDRPVALKHVKADAKDPATARERFRREARALARVRHPAVVEVYDWVEDEDGDWLIMELLEGRLLSARIADGPFEVRRALEIGRDVAAGLAAVHAHGIVHRDLSPANVMLVPPGLEDTASGTSAGHDHGSAGRVSAGHASAGHASAGRVKILDFGLAKRVASMDGVPLTETISREGQLLGTVRYMSPEQAAGHRVDRRSDIFSLGVVLYEMLTGVSPFAGETAVETLTRICTVAETPVHRRDPALPEAVSELVGRLLKKEPDRRLQTAAEVAEALDALAAGLAAGRPDHELRAALPASGSDSDVTSPTEVDGAHLRTLVLNDLVDSTTLVDKLGDERAAGIFEQHDRMARDLLQRCHGREIDKSDGFLMLFERPLDAVRFALGYHAALDEISEREGVEVRSRVGIHVGEVVLRVNSTEDVARGAKPLEVEGLAKAMAARLMGLAGPRQTLISRGVYDLGRRAAVGAAEMPDGLRWVAHGRYRMQGVEEPVEVFEVGAAGVAPLAAPKDTKKVKKVREVAGRLSGWRLRGAIAAMSVLLVLAVLGGWRLWEMREIPPPLYVAVPPTVVEAENAEELRLKASVIQAGLIQELQGYEGIAPVEPRGQTAEIAKPRTLALAMGAQEVLLSKLECSAGTCQIVLRRVSGNDESVVWGHRFIDPTFSLLDLTILVGEQLRGGFLGFSVREGVAELLVRPEDYEEFWRIHRRYKARDEGFGHERVVASLQEIQKTSPKFVQANLLEAQIRRLLFIAERDPRQLDASIEICQRILEVAPRHAQALRYLIRIMIEVDRLDEAASVLKELASIEPGDARVYELRAMLLERQGAPEEALKWMERAIQRQRSSVLLYNLADMQYRMGRVEEARQSLEASLELEPDAYDALSRLAQIELVDGDVQRSADLYEELVEKVPEPTELSNLGLAYLLLERYEEAARIFEEIRTSIPTSPHVLLNLADARLLLGEEFIARVLYEEVVTRITQDPDPDSLLTLKAQALAHLDRHQEAIEAVQSALGAQPNNPQIVYEAALVYSVTGEKYSALFHARHALALGLQERWFGFPWFDPIRHELANGRETDNP